MTKLNLPKYDYKLKSEDRKTFIFDFIRKRFVRLTPEEFVRQHFVAFLIGERGYLAGRIGNEVSLLLNGTKRRCDTVIYDNFGSPCAIIEYKAPNIAISKNTFDQIVRYNSVLRVKFLIVSNGIEHYCCMIDYANNNYTFVDVIPKYASMLEML